MHSNIPLVTVGLIATILLFNLPSDSSAEYSRAEAESYLKYVVLADSANTYGFYASRQSLDAGQQVVCQMEDYRAPDFRSWLFMVDYNYGARWTHPAHLYFIGVDSLQQVGHIDVGWWVTSPEMDHMGVITVDAIPRGEAMRHLREVLIADSVGSYKLGASVIPLEPESEVIIVEGDTLTSPNFRSWLLMVDWMWEFEWSHDAYLYFVDVEDPDNYETSMIGMWVWQPELEYIGMFGVEGDREQAFNNLIRVILRDSTGHYEVSAAESFIQPETGIRLGNGDEVISPWYPTWLFFVDWNYELDWTHTAWLIFQNVESLDEWSLHQIEWPVEDPPLDQLGNYGYLFRQSDAMAYFQQFVLPDSTGYGLHVSRYAVEPGATVLLGYGGQVEESVIAPDFRSWLVATHRQDNQNNAFDRYLYFLDADSLSHYRSLPAYHSVIDPEMDWFGIVAVDDTDETGRIPDQITISSAYPNPFNGQISIEYSLARSALVRLSILDYRGRLVEKVNGGFESAGAHQMIWEGRDVPSGHYIIRLESAGEILEKPAILVR